jgi:hypothetical protein
MRVFVIRYEGFDKSEVFLLPKNGPARLLFVIRKPTLPLTDE